MRLGGYWVQFMSEQELKYMVFIQKEYFYKYQAGMPIKPNNISAPSTPSIDGRNISQPARGLMQTVARLAKPFKAFTPRNDNAATVQPPDLQNKAPTPQMLAKAREQAHNMIARTASSASAAPDDLFSSPELDACRLKLMNIKLLVMDVEDQRNNLISMLADNSTSNQENQLQIRYEILKVDHILSETKVAQSECVERLNELMKLNAARDEGRL